MSERELTAQERARVDEVMQPFAGTVASHPWALGAFDAAWAKVAALVRAKGDAEAALARAHAAMVGENVAKLYAEAEVARLREALRKYGRHCPSCDLIRLNQHRTWADGSPILCTCGLVALAEAPRAD